MRGHKVFQCRKEQFLHESQVSDEKLPYYSQAALLSQNHYKKATSIIIQNLAASEAIQLTRFLRPPSFQLVIGSLKVLGVSSIISLLTSDTDLFIIEELTRSLLTS